MAAAQPVALHGNGQAEGDDASYSVGMQIVMSLALPMTLRAAIHVGLIDLLAAADGRQRPITASEAAAALPVLGNPDAAAAIDRMMGLLASYGVVSCVSDGSGAAPPELRYGLTPVGRWFCSSSNAASTLVDLAVLDFHETFNRGWYVLNDALLHGGNCFEKVHGRALYEYCGVDTGFGFTFNQAMRSHTTVTTEKLIERYTGFEGVTVLVDVGGGTGFTLGLITAKHPHIKGVNFDLPHVISKAAPLPRVSHVAGDMFKNVPAGDAIMIKNTLCNWSDEECVKLLKNCWDVLPVEGGKIFIVDYAKPATMEVSTVAQGVLGLDMYMLTMFGGKSRTVKEFESMTVAAGFSGFGATRFFGGLYVMEATK